MVPRLAKYSLPAAVAVSVLAGLALLVVGHQIVQGALALLLIFVLPGYAITIALFPEHSLGVTENVLITIVSSIAIVILGGLILNVTPWGLQSGSWVVLLVVVTLSAGLAAWLRRGKPRMVALPRLGYGFTLRQALLFVAALLVAGIALSVASTAAPPQEFQGYTLLSLAPSTNDHPNVLRLGVDCREFSTTAYRLTVKGDGRVVNEWPSIVLKPNESWFASIDVSATTLVDSRAISADLYRLDAPGSVYRHVELMRGQYRGG